MTCTYFRIIIHSTAYHHLQITWLSYFGSENQGLPLRSWFVTCWLWRHIPIVTSLAVPSSCVVTQTPMGTNSGTRRRKRKFPLLFVNCDRGRIEIDHLYGLRCRGWYCNPEQHSLCRPARPQAAARRPAQLVLFRIAVPTTPAQTVSWSIPITLTNMGQYFPRIHKEWLHKHNKTVYFVKPDQLDPWIKEQIKITLLPTILHLLLPNFVSCGRACPSHMAQNLVTVGAKLWTAERFLVDPWSMDYADPVW